LGDFNNLGIEDNYKLQDFYLTIDYKSPQKDSVQLLDTSFDISGINNDGKGGTLNDYTII